MTSFTAFFVGNTAQIPRCNLPKGEGELTALALVLPSGSAPRMTSIRRSTVERPQVEARIIPNAGTELLSGANVDGTLDRRPIEISLPAPRRAVGSQTG
jgi:hypothetical protein